MKNIVLIILKTLKFVMLFMALAYFFIWIAQIYAVGLFEKLDNIFYLLPDFFDNLVPVIAYINDRIVTMGYIYSALLMALVEAVILAVLLKTNKKAKVKEEQNTNKDLPIKKHKNQEKINFFCALFEFKLQQISDFDKSYYDIKKLKKEYCEIIKRKLNEKYSSNLKFVVTDKVFFVCNDFSLLNSIVVDILRLYKVICNIDNQKSIKTDYLMSFYASLDKTNVKENIKILYKINEFKNLNKIVVNHDIFLRYWDLKDKIFDFKPMDNVKISNINSKDEKLEVNLYYIKNVI